MPNSIYALSSFIEWISKKAAGLRYGEDAYEKINAKELEEQGVGGFFNPKMLVCDARTGGGNPDCYERKAGDICVHVFGEEPAALYSNTFIDWDNKIKKWKNVSTKKVPDPKSGSMVHVSPKTYNGPKLCSCATDTCPQHKSWKKYVDLAKYPFPVRSLIIDAISGNFKDNEYCKGEVQCAPVPLAPGPPPLCEQLAMSPPQVRIVPIRNQDNDYFYPRVGVIIGELGKRDLDFQRTSHEVEDGKGTTYYFKTYRKKDQLCAEYLGTQSIDEKNPQFIRCFPAPPAPEPEIVKVANENTLEIKMKMSESACTYEARGTYSNGSCTFNVTNHPVNIGPLSLKVVKPRIVEKTTKSNNDESNITDIIEGILRKNPQFEILEKYGYVPNIGIELPNGDSCSLTNPREHNQCELTKLELNNMGQPKIEVGYMGVKNQVNSNSKMLCLSGWQPEPEEFVLEREGKVVPLKSMGTKYIEYNSVYSKESNQFYYLPSKENKIDDDPLNKDQNQLNKIIFDKQGYVFFPDDNKQEKGKCSYCVKRNDEIDDAFKSSKGLKVVYKLTDVEHREKCNQGNDGCICFNGTCSRSTRYVDKENTQSFYTKISQDANGVVTQQEAPIKANRTEVFYADKLCRFDLEGLKKKLKEKLKEIIKEHLKNKKQELEKNSEKSYKPEDGDVYTDDLSIMFDSIEIEVWGSGEAGHIVNIAKSKESRSGMPGDYIKAKLKIDPNYPVIKVKVTEGGGNQENNSSDKDGGPIFIEMCRLDKQDCKPLITVAGGGMHKVYGPKNTRYKNTIIHEPGLELEKTIIPASTLKSTEDNKTEDNKIAYIENGKIKYEIIECKSRLRSNKPGAGGCIDKSKRIYGKGSPGYVKIRPIIKEFDEEGINAAIKKVIEDQYDLETMTDFWVGDLNVNISGIIEEEVKKELLR